MDSDAPSTQFNSVKHHIVSLGSHLSWFTLEERNIFIHWGSEGVMDGYKAFIFFIPLEKWEFGHPQEV